MSVFVASNGMMFTDESGFSSEFGSAMKIEDYQTAEVIGRNATELDPDQVGSWVMLSTALLQQGKFAAAIEAADQAIERSKESVHLYCLRGLISQMDGDALHRFGKHHEAFDSFGIAIDWFQRARGLDFQEPMVYFGLAACHEGLGDDDYVIALAAHFLRIAPEHPSATQARDMIRVAQELKNQDS